MKVVNYGLIASGAYTKGDKDVFSGMQDYYKSTIEALILNNIGEYDTSKYYVFGDPTATYFISGGGDGAFQAGSKNIAYKNGIFYTLDSGIMANPSGASLSEEITQTSKLFSDNVSRNFITEYRLIQDNTTGTITGNDIVPLFIFLKTTTPTMISPNIMVWRDGNYICINHYPVTVTGNVVFTIDLSDYGGGFIDRILTSGDYISFPAFVNNVLVRATCAFLTSDSYTITIPVTGTQLVECDARISIFTGYH